MVPELRVSMHGTYKSLSGYPEPLNLEAEGSVVANVSLHPVTLVE